MGTLFQQSAGRGTWSDLVAGIARLTRWPADREVFEYVESADRCSLGPISLGSAAPPELAFEGRLFDADAEARWVCHEDGTFEGWVVREGEEADLKDSRKTYASRRDRRYYLLGIATAKPGVFAEARFPNVAFTYPVEQVSRQDRAFINVAEYHLAAPDWGPLAGEEDKTEDELNRPILFAHRFFGVGAGTDR